MSQTNLLPTRQPMRLGIATGFNALVLLFALTLLSGCMVGPNFSSPVYSGPDAWLEAEDERIQPESVEHAEWWKHFSDPALEKLIAASLEHNQALEIAGLRIYEGRAQVGLAVGTLYPQSSSVSLSRGSVELSELAEPVSYLPPLVQTGVDTEYSTYRIGFNSAWELDFWGRFRRTVELANASLAAREAAYDAVVVTLTAEVSNAYILLRTIEQRLLVANSNLETRKRSQRISDVRHRNELTSELDIVQATVQVNNTQSLIPRLETALAQVENALSLLVGEPPGKIRDIIGGPADIPLAASEVAVGIPADLLRRRPDIRRAEHLAAAQSAAIGVTKAELYPALSLVGSIGYSATDFSDIGDNDGRSSLGLAGIRWNIFNFGKIKNRVRANDARFQQALEVYEITVLNALREAEDAQIAFLKSKDELASLTIAADQAQRAVELANIQYTDGLVDFNRVLFAQQAQQLQQDLLVSARGRAASNLVAVYRSLGGGWQQTNRDDVISTDSKSEMKARTNWKGILED